jgi:hypothetical protein
MNPSFKPVALLGLMLAIPAAGHAQEQEYSVDNLGDWCTDLDNAIKLFEDEKIDMALFKVCKNKLTDETKKKEAATKFSSFHFKNSVDHRCDADSLGNEQALGRNEWSLKNVPYQSDEVTSNIRTWIEKKVGEGNNQYHYPTFKRMKVDSAGGVRWDPPVRQFPITKDDPFQYPEGHWMSHLCMSGCFTGSQQILFPSGYEAITSATAQKDKLVVALARNATLENINFSVEPVASFMESDEAKQEVLTFVTEAGRKITVTKNHPLADFSGQLRMAESFVVGDKLVSHKGEADRIASITPASFFGKVHHVKMVSGDEKANVIVAQGLLSGSARYQNEEVEKLNRVLLRENVAAVIK